jgi:hypothetical protein
MSTPRAPSASDFIASDAELQKNAEFKKSHEKFGHLPSADVINTTVKSLEGKTHKVHVVDTEAAALDVIKGMIKDGSSVCNGYSTTLEQIGYVEWVKTIDSKITNYKGKSAAAQAAGDHALSAEMMSKGAVSDLWISSCAAISQDGQLYVGDLTGTRLMGWNTAKHLLVVASASKIVKDENEALERLYKYQLPLESARVRVAYKMPASAVNNLFALKGPNPWGAPRVTVILIKKENLGF